MYLVHFDFYRNFVGKHVHGMHENIQYNFLLETEISLLIILLYVFDAFIFYKYKCNWKEMCCVAPFYFPSILIFDNFWLDIFTVYIL